MNVQIEIDPDFRCFCGRRTFTYLELAELIECTFCMELFEPAEARPKPASIPYDEMRRILNLPDVSAYIARRDREVAWQNMWKGVGEAFQRVATVWTEAVDQMLPGLEALIESAKPRHTPPMWAVVPGHSPRTLNRATDIRTPFR